MSFCCLKIRKLFSRCTKNKSYDPYYLQAHKRNVEEKPNTPTDFSYIEFTKIIDIR